MYFKKGIGKNSNLVTLTIIHGIDNIEARQRSIIEMSVFNLIFKDFVKLRHGDKVAQPGQSIYGNIAIAKDLNAEPDLGGILADGVVLVDLDNNEEAERLLNLVRGENLKCVVVKTDRGHHFYFKTNEELLNRSKSLTALGVTIDVKCANGGKTCYAVIKRNGTWRQVVYGAQFTELDYYPDYLQGITVRDASKFRRFYEMGDGDGRNDYLHQYWKFVLTGNKFSLERVREIFTLINNYMLREPLSQRELESIARDEVINSNSSFEPRYFSQNENGNGENRQGRKMSKREERKFVLFELAKKIIEKYHIVRLENDGKDDLLYYYDDNHYKLFINESLIASIIIEEAETLQNELLSKGDVDNVLTYIKAKTKRILRDALARQKELYLATNNKLLIFNEDRTITLTEPTHTKFCTVKINVNYNPDAKSDLIDKFFKDISNDDPKTEQLLKEVVGYCLYPKNVFRKTFFLIGNGGNGKSTYQNLIRDFLGLSNASNISLFDIENNRFAPANLKDKLVNLGDDIDADDFNKLSKFKTITSGDTISAEFKGLPAFSFQPFCKLIYSANVSPLLRDSTDGIKSRVICIPFDRKFIKDDTIDELDYVSKLNTTANMEYLLQLGLNSLESLFNRGKFEMSEKSKKLTEDALRDADPIVSFLIDYESQGFTVYDQLIYKIYSLFTSYCKKNGIDAKGYTIIMFSKKVRSYYRNLSTKKAKVNGKTQSIFYGLTSEEFSILKELDISKEDEEKAEPTKESASIEESTEPTSTEEPTVPAPAPAIATPPTPPTSESTSIYSNFFGDNNCKLKRMFYDEKIKQSVWRNVNKLTDENVNDMMLFDDVGFTDEFISALHSNSFRIRQNDSELILHIPAWGIMNRTVQNVERPDEEIESEILRIIKEERQQ